MPEPTDLSLFDAPPVPRHLGKATAPPAVSHASAVTLDTSAEDTFDASEFDAEDAPTLPPRLHRAKASQVAPISLADVAELPAMRTQGVEVVPGNTEPSDWVLIAIGAGVAITGITMLALVFSGY